jgi:hypothetical protein
MKLHCKRICTLLCLTVRRQIEGATHIRSAENAEDESHSDRRATAERKNNLIFRTVYMI